MDRQQQFFDLILEINIKTGMIKDLANSMQDDETISSKSYTLSHFLSLTIDELQELNEKMEMVAMNI